MSRSAVRVHHPACGCRTEADALAEAASASSSSRIRARSTPISLWRVPMQQHSRLRARICRIARW
ncbi:hypothetical protein [Azospirillum sp. SYSU D00513]|uniref:hypothetical protein n=1 Tax=Azospirillum sp. SYSU D00513 TaxID=2812561 RepID=UPI001A973832|nr:hypothetical protein [Azospirillum sp. SYSU D00513]